MCPDFRSPVDFKAFLHALGEAVANARSLDEIAAWLASQPSVRSVTLEDYLMKSNPPQRDFSVELEIGNGSSVTKIVNVIDAGNGRFQFRTLRDQ
jgi:hypothetical protein